MAALFLVVLTDGFLLRTIALFQRGLPQDLALLARAHAAPPAAPLPQLATEENDLALLQRLYRYYTEQPEYYQSQPKLSFDGVYATAVKLARTQLMAWMETQPCLLNASSTSKMWSAAIDSRDDEMVRHIVTRWPELAGSLSAEHVRSLLDAGRLEMLRWLHDQEVRVPYTPDVLTNVVRFSSLATIRFVHEHAREDWAVAAIDVAAERGDLDILRFLHDHRTDGCTVKAMDRAAQDGNLAVVQFLHAHRTEGCTTRAMDEAAANGHLDVFRFLFENRAEGCTQAAVDFASMNGHAEVVRFILDNRIQLTVSAALERAATFGRRDIVEYLLLHVGEESVRQAMVNAFQENHVDIAELLHEHRKTQLTLPATVCVLTRQDLESIQELVSKYHRVRQHVAIGVAAKNGELTVVEFFHTHFHEHCTATTIYEAAEIGQLAVVQYLREHCDAQGSSVVIGAVYSGELAMARYAVEAWGTDRVAEALAVARRRKYTEIEAYLSSIVEGVD